MTIYQYCPHLLYVEFGLTGAPRFVFGGEGLGEGVVRADPEAIYNLCFHLKTVMKIMPKSPSRPLFRLQEKLKLKNKRGLFVSFITVFSIPVY
jgi:hypothetical protein